MAESIQDEVVLALLLLDEDEKDQKNIEERQCWIQPLLTKRETLGAFNTKFQDVRMDPQKCRAYIRMNNTQFLYLVDLLSEDLQKENTQMRKCISPEEKICLTLRYLATGETFRSLEFQFRISRKTISDAVISTANSLVKRLGAQYLSTPKSEESWIEIADKFNERWNFPNGLGAIDGKHIVIRQPGKSGSHYRNYKGTDSIVLMAMVGPEYEFLYVEVGANGRNSDGGIWDRCDLKKAIEKETLNLPAPRVLPNGDCKLPFVITGDDAFPLKPYLMKPYPMKNLSLEKRIFNYRLSRMRRISENGFGILANRWRIFRRSIALEPEKVKTITLAAITLHNWQSSISSIGKVDLPNGLVDQENSSNEIISGNWRDEEPTGTWFPITNDKFGTNFVQLMCRKRFERNSRNTSTMKAL